MIHDSSGRSPELNASRTLRLDLGLIALVYLATRLPFLHLAGFPDGDANQMALGIADAVRSGAGFHGERLYGTAFTTGYYALFFALAPLHGGEPARLIPLLNGIGLAAGLVAQVAFAWLLRSLWGRAACLAGSTLLLFTPGWWELNTFGHPTPLALALFLVALCAFFRFLSGTSRRSAWVALAAASYAGAVLVRADLLLAGLAFPTLAWIRTRKATDAAFGVGLVALASLVVATAIRGWIGGPSPGSGDLAGQVLSIFEFDFRTIVKKSAVAALGAGPALTLVLVASWVGCLLSKRMAPLAVATSVVLPEVLWWLPVEGPFRQWLVAYAMALIPAAVWLGSRNSRNAVAAAIVLVVINQIAAAALYEPIVARYPWTYREVQGERRWSTRAPIGDWFHHHETAKRAIRREVQEARLVASYPGPSILVVAPAPYRMEWEILSQNATYDYVSRVDEGALWVGLNAGGRHFLFLEGNPSGTRRALERAYASGGLDSMPVFVPIGTAPIDSYPFPKHIRLNPIVP